MVARLKSGPRDWRMTRDTEGYRNYRAKFLVLCDRGDGPAVALTCPGLPRPQTEWRVDNDLDLWAWCLWDAQVTPLISDGEPTKQFEVELLFSTKPPNIRRCVDIQPEDPLLIPDRISGSFTRFTEEITQDRFGRPLVTSSWEQLRGPQVEFDKNRPSVRIEQNRPLLELPLFTPMIDTVNIAPLWGLPRRWIKLSNVSWERKFYAACYVYYQRTLDFEINPRFDRDLLDEGTKVLNGHWDPDTGRWFLDPINGELPNRFNPAHFMRAVDRSYNPCRLILDGRGRPWNPEGFHECVLDTYANAKLRAQVIGASAIRGPYSSSPECETAIVDPGNEWWCIQVSFNEGETFDETYCIKGDANDADLEAENALLLGDNITAFSSGPFTSEAACLARCSGAADPVTWWRLETSDANPGNIHVEYYRESDFTLLGIPTILEG